jgi:hypothetical protein
MVAYVPAIAEAPAPPGTAVTLDILADDRAEADRVVDYVRLALSEANASIAIPCAPDEPRKILPALREAGIAYAAVELDALAERQAILDLVSLTHALVQPPIALRGSRCCARLGAVSHCPTWSPWWRPSTRSLHERLRRCSRLPRNCRVVGRRRQRLSNLAQCLWPAIAARGARAFYTRAGAWLALGGGAILDEAIDIGAAERYFALLAQHDVAGDIPDWPAFVAALDYLHAEAPADPAVRVQVMTLHRAKGLEFDTVIIPGLAKAPRNREAEVLRLRVREQGLLLAPMRARGGDMDPVYTYLSYLAVYEDRAELGRLLYVGCTRARRRLHLTAALGVKTDEEGHVTWKVPAAATALARMWEALGKQVAHQIPT